MLDFLIQLSVCTESTPRHEKAHTVATTTGLIINCSTPELCRGIKNNSILRRTKRDLRQLHVALTNVTWQTQEDKRRPLQLLPIHWRSIASSFEAEKATLTSRRTTLPDTHTQTVFKMEHMIRTQTLSCTSSLTSNGHLVDEAAETSKWTHLHLNGPLWWYLGTRTRPPYVFVNRLN